MNIIEIYLIEYNYFTSYIDIDLHSSLTYILLLEEVHNQQVGPTQWKILNNLAVFTFYSSLMITMQYKYTKC